MTRGRRLIDRLDDTRDLGRVFRIDLNADLVSFPGEIGILHRLPKCLPVQPVFAATRKRTNFLYLLPITA